MRKYRLLIIVLILITLFAVFGRAIYFKTFGYCTLQNKCPVDKCNQIMSCVGGGPQYGCAGAVTGCEFKDKKLLWNYKQITEEQARSCAEKYISENRSKFRLYNMNALDEHLYVTGHGTWDPQDDYYTKYIVGPIDDRDTHLYRVYNDSVEILVGAQTCKVYPSTSMFGTIVK